MSQRIWNVFTSGETIVQFIKEVQNGGKGEWGVFISPCSSEHPLSD